MAKRGYVYILASKRNGTLYIGVTSDLQRRINEHRAKAKTGFTSEYNVSLLVHVEEYPSMRDAIVREKQLKKWNRSWKLNLIEQVNPTWRDLYMELPVAATGTFG